MEGSSQDGFDFLASGPASTSGRSDAELLKSALMNEKAAPEILAFETDLIARIEQNMDYQASAGGRQGQAAAGGGSCVAPPAAHAHPPRRRPLHSCLACRTSR